MAAQETGGVKNDGNKIRLELLSRMWLLGTGAVLTYGGRKYAADNWRLGMNRRRLMGAAMRHMFAYLDGEDLDPETGMSHIYHASCELMFIAELHETHPTTDDRYKVDPAAMSRLLESLEKCLASTVPANVTK